MRFILIEASAEFVHMSTENILIYYMKESVLLGTKPLVDSILLGDPAPI